MSLPLWGAAAEPSASPAGVARVPDWGDPRWLLGDWANRAPTVVSYPRLASPSAIAGSHGAPQRLGQDVSARYLAAVARAESGFVARAHASTSSAAGPFQFLSQTWLLTLHRHGRCLGLGLEASLVRIGADGRARVISPEARAALLALRYDPQIASALAGALTRENAEALKVALGRPPTGAELYAAHVLGPGPALQLLSASRVTPNLPAAAIFPAAAASNPGLFYTGGAPRSVLDLMGTIAAKESPDGRPVIARRTGLLAEDELVNLPPESPSY